MFAYPEKPVDGKIDISWFILDKLLVLGVFYLNSTPFAHKAVSLYFFLDKINMSLLYYYCPREKGFVVYHLLTCPTKNYTKVFCEIYKLIVYLYFFLIKIRSVIRSEMDNST